MSDAVKKTIKIKFVKPKPWQKPDSEQYWYTVVIEGEGEPLSYVQDRDKGAPAPEEGKTYEGNYYEDGSKRKFYAFKPESGPKASGGYQKSPEDRDSIYRCNALNNAVALYGNVDAKVPEQQAVLSAAETFYAWLKGETPASGHDKAAAVAEKLKKPSIGQEDYPEPDLSWIRDEE